MKPKFKFWLKIVYTEQVRIINVISAHSRPIYTVLLSLSSHMNGYTVRTWLEFA